MLGEKEPKLFDGVISPPLELEDFELNELLLDDAHIPIVVCILRR